ncbi:MAG TPA: outer membrane lipoprotein-sorting protein [Acidobacteriaceae bacterium]|nr:outer membrane lipoprotein-sorting protein [Acidobacteriaceae bacterium]
MRIQKTWAAAGNRIFGALVLLLLSVHIHYAQAQPAGNAALDKVLAQMDKAAASFHSAQADFQWDQFERVVSSTDSQTGVIYFLRSGTAMQMAADILTYDGQPAKKIVVFRDGVLKFYQPQIDQMTVIHAGEKKDQFESYLALGFGASGSDLKKSWDITYEGMETLDGVQTAKLDLVSKVAADRNTISHLTIWVDPARAISLKQIMFEASGDSRTAYYRNIQYNKKVSSSVFKIKTDSKTQVVQK